MPFLPIAVTFPISSLSPRPSACHAVSSPMELLVYETESGQQPFVDWFAKLDGAIVLLLGGSGKSDQERAIKRARDRLKDFRDWNDDKSSGGSCRKLLSKMKIWRARIPSESGAIREALYRSDRRWPPGTRLKKSVAYQNPVIRSIIQ
jgi:hypothetical protein